MSEQELQDRTVQSLPGDIDRTAPSTVRQLLIGTVQEQEPGRFVAAVKGGQEEGRLALKRTKSMTLP